MVPERDQPRNTGPGSVRRLLCAKSVTEAEALRPPLSGEIFGRLGFFLHKGPRYLAFGQRGSLVQLHMGNKIGLDQRSQHLLQLFRRESVFFHKGVIADAVFNVANHLFCAYLDFLHDNPHQCAHQFPRRFSDLVDGFERSGRIGLSFDVSIPGAAIGERRIARPIEVVRPGHLRA